MAAGRWSVTTNQTNASVTAVISGALPAGVTLAVALDAPQGAVSAGRVVLGTAAATVVTGISRLQTSDLAMKYELDASAMTQAVSSTTRVVTFTITGGV